MENIYDVVIVGSGPSGMTAAIYAKRANLKTLLLDKLSPGGQILNTNEVENYPGAGNINGAELAIKMFEHTQELEIEFDYRTVRAIKKGDDFHTIECEEDDMVYKTRSVIIASGTAPRRLHVQGEDRFAGNGISWCAICDGAQYRDKAVVVIGGGNSAVEEAIFLAGICTQVTIVTMFDLTADPKACDRLRAMPNVAIHVFQDILEFTGTEKLTGVRFASTEDKKEQYVECDGVFEYIGFQAMSDFFTDLGICDRTGCIEVDKRMQTSIPGIFGAGDITVKHLRQIVTACADGATAANTAASYIESLKG